VKLGDLKVSDRFYYQGDKFMVFIKPINLPREHSVICTDWPNPNGTHRFSSEMNVKPLERIKP